MCKKTCKERRVVTHYLLGRGFTTLLAQGCNSSDTAEIEGNLGLYRGMPTSIPPTRFRPTPPALKWMAEKRARTAHDLLVTTQLLEELTGRSKSLQEDLSALDKVIQMYDPNVTPSDIAPINGWQGSYGKRGALRVYILDVIKNAAPNWIATDHIRLLVQGHFGIAFATPDQYARWRRGSFRGTVKKLCSDGLIEREHDPDARDGLAGRWRWSGAAESPKLSSLER